MKNKDGSQPNYQASTIQKFHCICENPDWTRLLIGNGKQYEAFLVELVERKFYNDSGKRQTITTMSKELNFKAAQVTKWISDIYNDVFILNDTNPELFYTPGSRHDVSFVNLKHTAYFSIWLPQTPRLYEGFEFFFIKAKVGSGSFWVKDIRHLYDNGQYSVWLTVDSKATNKYRDLLVDKAEFNGIFGFMDFFKKSEDEIDTKLRKWYKNL